MKIIATIEARMTSTRLPGKILLPILGRPALERMIERVKYAKYIDEIIVATTIKDTDDKIEDLCNRLKISCYRGSENDVLSRVLEAARTYSADLICELTGDCPLVDPVIIDQIITAHLAGDYDYTSNFLNQWTFPMGLNVQVFPTRVLEKVSQLTSDPVDRVHVSCFIYRNPRIFKLNSVTANSEVFAPDFRLTLDTPQDYKLIQLIYDALYRQDRIFLAKEIIGYLKKNPVLLQINKSVHQKEIDEG